MDDETAVHLETPLVAATVGGLEILVAEQTVAAMASVAVADLVGKEAVAMDSCWVVSRVFALGASMAGE